MNELPAPSEQFPPGPGHLLWFFIEAPSPKENVFKVFRRYSRFLDPFGIYPLLTSPPIEAIESDEKTIAAIQEGFKAAEESGERPGWSAFKSDPYGLQTQDGRRFVSFMYKPGNYALYWEELGKRFCREEGRCWGQFQDGRLSVSDGTSYPESELKVIETNPPGRRASDRPLRPPRTPEDELLSARMNARIVPQVELHTWHSEESRQQDREYWESRAVQFLKKAIAGGLPNAAAALADPEFDLLRHRGDFQALLKEVQ